MLLLDTTSIIIYVDRLAQSSRCQRTGAPSSFMLDLEVLESEVFRPSWFLRRAFCHSNPLHPLPSRRSPGLLPRLHAGHGLRGCLLWTLLSVAPPVNGDGFSLSRCWLGTVSDPLDAEPVVNLLQINWAICSSHGPRGSRRAEDDGGVRELPQVDPGMARQGEWRLLEDLQQDRLDVSWVLVVVDANVDRSGYSLLAIPSPPLTKFVMLEEMRVLLGMTTSRSSSVSIFVEGSRPRPRSRAGRRPRSCPQRRMACPATAGRSSRCFRDSVGQTYVRRTRRATPALR